MDKGQESGSNEASRKHLDELIASFATAMLVTRSQDGAMRARPLTVAGHEPGGQVYFSTNVDSPKVDEIEDDAHVVVTFQSAHKYASLSGTARLSRDRSLIERLWKESWKVWFPAGKDGSCPCHLDRVAGSRGVLGSNGARRDAIRPACSQGVRHRHQTHRRRRSSAKRQGTNGTLAGVTSDCRPRPSERITRAAPTSRDARRGDVVDPPDLAHAWRRRGRRPRRSPTNPRVPLLVRQRATTRGLARS